jgi:hypothetical protein
MFDTRHLANPRLTISGPEILIDDLELRHGEGRRLSSGS